MVTGKMGKWKNPEVGWIHGEMGNFCYEWMGKWAEGMAWSWHLTTPFPTLPFPPPLPPQKKETRDRRSGHCLHLQSIWRIQVSFCILSMRRRKRRESCSQVTEPSDSFLFGYLIHWTKARREMKQLKVNIYHKYLLNQFLPFIFFL